MKHIKSLLLLAVIYLLVQGLGLWMAAGGLWVEEGLVEQIIENPELGIVQNPESVESSGQVFLYILAATAVILLFIKLRLGFLMNIFVALSIFIGMALTLSNLLGTAGFLAAVGVSVLRLWKKENVLLMNLSLIFAIPGVGSWVGASLDVLPALVLLLVLTVYDIVAVFGTKHMVTLADNSKSGSSLMFSIPVGERCLGLGTGDLAIPLIFAVSLLREYSLAASIITVCGGLLGLVALFFYITQEKDVLLPALPPITVGLLFGFGVSLLIG